MSASNNQCWLITGGAGYIGSHIADEFLTAGKNIVIYDSLYKGLKSRIDYLSKMHNTTINFIEADIRDEAAFTAALKDFKVTGIVHTAALKSVEESMSKRDEYLEVNYHATKRMLEIAKKHGVTHFIFSSTAAVYGNPSSFTACEEAGPTNPINPYGESKLLAEAEVSNFASVVGNIATSFRFFNVIGTGNPELLDNSTSNLVPIIQEKLKSHLPITIFGSGYPTPDGTCIRDYVDVRDIATAHLLAANSNKQLPSAMNIGTGHGASVKEVIDLALQIAGEPNAQVLTADGRSGDPAILFASVDLVENSFGFKCRYSLENSLRSVF
jgi:UDP-glucose 4-epimerase